MHVHGDSDAFAFVKKRARKKKGRVIQGRAVLGRSAASSPPVNQEVYPGTGYSNSQRWLSTSHLCVHVMTHKKKKNAHGRDGITLPESTEPSYWQFTGSLRFRNKVFGSSSAVRKVEFDAKIYSSLSAPEEKVGFCLRPFSPRSCLVF